MEHDQAAFEANGDAPRPKAQWTELHQILFENLEGLASRGGVRDLNDRHRRRRFNWRQ